MRKEPDRLDGVTDAAPQRLGRHRCHVLAADPDRSRIARDQPVDHSECRRLAAAGGAEQHAELPGADSQRQSVDDPSVAIGFGDVVDLDHGAARLAQHRDNGLQDEVGGERQEDRRQGAEQNEIGRVLAEPFEDEGAEPAGADQCGDDREPDRLHRHDAQPGQQYRKGERQLDLPEDLPLRQPHTAPGFDDGAVDTGKAGGGIAHHRQQRVEHQRHDRRGDPDAADAECRKRRHGCRQGRERNDQQSEESDRRDRL